MFFLNILTFLIASRKPTFVLSTGGTAAIESATASESVTARESATARVSDRASESFTAGLISCFNGIFSPSFFFSAAFFFSCAAFFAARFGSFSTASSIAFAAASAAFLRYSPTGSTSRSFSLLSAKTTAIESTLNIGMVIYTSLSAPRYTVSIELSCSST